MRRVRIVVDVAVSAVRRRGVVCAPVVHRAATQLGRHGPDGVQPPLIGDEREKRSVCGECVCVCLSSRFSIAPPISIAPAWGLPAQPDLTFMAPPRRPKSGAKKYAPPGLR